MSQFEFVVSQSLPISIMKKRILVFPCGSEIGLELHRSIKHSKHFELIGLSSVNDHGRFVYENYISGIGNIDDENFLVDLKYILNKNKIDFIYPTMDRVITFLKENENFLGKKIIGPNLETAKICNSKKKTYQTLSYIIRVPKMYNDEEKLDFPLFSKPDIGYGSRGVRKINLASELLDFDFKKNILCEYLPGKEFTVDCFTGLSKNLIFVGARERSRVSNGISVNTKTSKELTEAFYVIAEKINKNLNLFGAWFFQIKMDVNNSPCLLEVGCRIAGSSAVHRVQGFNLALADLFLATGIEPKPINNNFIVEGDRALNYHFHLDIIYDTVFIDYDDTIIINDKVNLEAIQLIFYLHNKGKEVVLITKHRGNLKNHLKHFRLESLFNDIIHLDPSEDKAEFIRQRKADNSIFIDDSFQERWSVFEKLNIPVFDVDSISALLC